MAHIKSASHNKLHFLHFSHFLHFQNADCANNAENATIILKVMIIEIKAYELT